MRVISCDPGYDRCGFAIIERIANQKDEVVFSTCIQTSSKDNFLVRLKTVCDSFQEIITEYSPEHFAVENLFFNNNQKTALRVSELRGALLYTALSHDLHIHEYTPLQIKSAVAGNGRATKQEVTRMVHLLTNFSKEKVIDDEYDAIACGLCFTAHYRPEIGA